MGQLEIGLIVVLVVCAAILLLMLIPEDRLQKFQQDCLAAGMDFEESQSAIAMRVAFVELRRRASDICIAQDGDMSRERINAVAGDLAIGLAAGHGHEAAKSFIAWVDACPDEEILYDDARAARRARAVDALRTDGLWPPKNMGMSPDHLRDAFKIVR